MSNRGIRKIEFDSYNGTSEMPELSFVKVRGSRSSGQRIVPDMLIVQETAGVFEYADGYKTADGTGSASRKILGLCTGVADVMKGPLDRQYIGAADDGGAFFIKADDLLVLRGFEDGVASLITSLSSYTTGLIGIVAGTVSPGASGGDTNFPNQYCNDLLDSSDYHASDSKVATLLGLDPGFDNVKPRQATGTVVRSTTTVGSITITDGGAYYTQAPKVTFAGGAGTGAAGTAVLTDGVVTSVTITNAGSGYSSDPTVTFSVPAHTVRFKITSAYRAY